MAVNGGGGLYNDGGTMTVIDATISDNVADGDAGSGGGILANEGSSLSVSQQQHRRATASNRAGGGIEVNATVTNTVGVTLTDVALTENATGDAPGNGGALHITGPGEVFRQRRQRDQQHGQRRGRWSVEFRRGHAHGRSGGNSRQRRQRRHGR